MSPLHSAAAVLPQPLHSVPASFMVGPAPEKLDLPANDTQARRPGLLEQRRRRITRRAAH
ncbi:MAG: hypothetical protein R3B98_04340 [Hyphomonas sp.]